MVNSMCQYGLFAQPGGNCSSSIVGKCNACGRDTCRACYDIGQEHYEGKCPCGNGIFILD